MLRPSAHIDDRFVSYSLRKFIIINICGFPSSLPIEVRKRGLERGSPCQPSLRNVTSLQQYQHNTKASSKSLLRDAGFDG
jgi:hypothetical protein